MIIIVSLGKPAEKKKTHCKALENCSDNCFIVLDSRHVERATELIEYRHIKPDSQG